MSVVLSLQTLKIIEYKYLCCNKNCWRTCDENSKKRLDNTYKFANHHINKFILLSQKGVCPYEYMNDLERFYEILPK